MIYACVSVGVLVFLLIVFVIIEYNRLIQARNKTTEAFSSIDVHLKMRYDLIPNLVNVVQGYVKHEAEVMKMVADIRSKSKAAENEHEKAQIAGEAGQVLKRLFATQENYPDLKSNKMFKRLQRELVDIEGKISAARRFYNAEVNKYNNMVMRFPTNIVAKMFKFKKKENFEFEPIKNTDIISFEGGKS